MKIEFGKKHKPFTLRESHLFVGIVALLWVYLIFRGILVQPIHDEVATFFTFVQSGRFLPYFSEWTTNNHLLNSLLTWFSFKIFGSSPIALRLPNLLFFPFFGYFLWRISSYINYKGFRWGFLISILFIHSFLEFFALSRGYGLALTLLTGSIWFTMRSFESPTIKNFILSMVFGFLSVSAILINVNSLIVIVGLLLINVVFNANQTSKRLKKLLFILIAGIVPAILAVRYLNDLDAAGRLDYGGDQGFWQASVKDLTAMLVGENSGLLNWYIIILSVAILVAFVFSFRMELQKKMGFRLLLNPRWILLYLLLGNLTGFFIEHHLFGVLYPGNRTSIQFIIFFTGSAFFLFDSFSSKIKSILLLLLLPLVIFPLQFLASINFSKISIENEAIPISFFNTIKAKSMEEKGLPTIQGYKGRELRWAYLNYREKAQMPMIHCSSYPDYQADFQIVYPDENPGWWLMYDSIDADRISGLYLLERKTKLKRNKLTTNNINPSIQMTNEEYFAISRGNVDTLDQINLFAEFELQIECADRSFDGWIVFVVSDSEGNQIRYERVMLNWYNQEWVSGEGSLRTGLLITDLPEDASTYLTYIWNLNKKEFAVKTLNYSLFLFEND